MQKEKYILKFALSTARAEPGRGQRGRDSAKTFGKAFTFTLFLDNLKPGKFQSQSRMQQTVDANANMSNPRQQANNARALAVDVSYSA